MTLIFISIDQDFVNKIKERCFDACEMEVEDYKNIASNDIYL